MRFNHHHEPRERSEASDLGATLVEYALMVALIAVVCVGAVSYFGSSNGSGLNRSADCILAAHAGEQLPDNC